MCWLYASQRAPSKSIKMSMAWLPTNCTNVFLCLFHVSLGIYSLFFEVFSYTDAESGLQINTHPETLTHSVPFWVILSFPQFVLFVEIKSYEPENWPQILICTEDEFELLTLQEFQPHVTTSSSFLLCFNLICYPVFKQRHPFIS